MSRADQIDSAMKRELSQVINKEVQIENCLITITFAKCSPGLKEAKVGVSVLPDNLTGTALRELKKKSGLIATSLKKKTKWRRTPTFIWKVDRSTLEASQIDEILENLS